ncbi:hypothetical protein EJ04DRAFT_596123 [Polyplosphaeria fusca]|uniref:Uncharacterized protein n=1 Tax=Polyplosphaeria fusca TaxID=682080 RepID=A0A9P4V1V4_9PLEO|nr:hypothetical protein EJ04DRAFT_596123 [Polyplosphaeria fusca]
MDHDSLGRHGEARRRLVVVAFGEQAGAVWLFRIDEARAGPQTQHTGSTLSECGDETQRRQWLQMGGRGRGTDSNGERGFVEALVPALSPVGQTRDTLHGRVPAAAAAARCRQMDEWIRGRGDAGSGQHSERRAAGSSWSRGQLLGREPSC